MSSPYPVLDNRPIDLWKVTELKEELKRRKLTTKGLKDDLIKRLAEALRVENENNEALLAERVNAEALRIEKENAKANVDNDIDGVPHSLDDVEATQPDPSLGGTVRNIVDFNITQLDEADDTAIKVDDNHSVAALYQGKVNEGDKLVGADSARVEANVAVHMTIAETVTTVSEIVSSELALGGQDLQNTKTQKENGNSKPQTVFEDSKSLLEDEVMMPKRKGNGIESADRMVMPETSPPNNQVSEVIPTLGSQVKYDSISDDSISYIEKIELKDNITADNVKIELDVKPVMVDLSSNNVDTVDGESHSMNVEETHEIKTYAEWKDDSNAANIDMSKQIDTVDVGYSESLNLDRSSGDDSMEEDFVETRQIDSMDNSADMEDRGEKTEIPLANEETPVDVAGDGLSLNKDIHVEKLNHAAVSLVSKESPIGTPAEKRKLNDQGAVESNEPQKRQRRWNSESVKVPESQSSNLTPTTTPKSAFQSTDLKHNFSMSGSKSSGEDAPTERVVPPSQKPPTNSLRIDCFLRPFTLKAVQELLGKTGTVDKFWMDQIKTHCFVTYSSVEEATGTRNAVYNLQWPPNGGRLLVAEFVDPQEVTTRADAPPAPVAPVSASPTAHSVPPAPIPVPSPRQPVPRPHPLPPPPPLPKSNLPPLREHLPLPPPPPLDPPIVTLDDLFRKTSANPRIYYLPLSEEQVAAKASVGKKQHA